MSPENVRRGADLLRQLDRVRAMFRAVRKSDAKSPKKVDELDLWIPATDWLPGQRDHRLSLIAITDEPEVYGISANDLSLAIRRCIVEGLVTQLDAIVHELSVLGIDIPPEESAA